MSISKFNWHVRLKKIFTSSPYSLGVSITVLYLLVLNAFHGFYLLFFGFPDGFKPFWQDEIWWPEFVNAILTGYIPAALMIARRGIERDLNQLRPWLPVKDVEIDAIRISAMHTGTFGNALKFFGLVIGFSFAFYEPALSYGTEHTIKNPVFMWALLRTTLFSWLIFVLLVSDLNATRIYFHIGRNLIKIDLLEMDSLSTFGRRGLRSALIWVIFSLVFSFFWVGEQASSANPYVLGLVLIMATGAFTVPLIGVRNNIQTVKQLTLNELRSDIRKELSDVDGSVVGDKSASPRLANLILYYQLIEKTREWPIDAANLLKFGIYLFIGLGSWLGSAVVERLLDKTLSG